MYFDSNNPGYEYHSSTTPLKETSEEKYPGVFITNNLKPSRQVTKAASNANSMPGLLKKTMTCLDLNKTFNLYNTLIRPHLEYCIQSWAPFTKGDIEQLEQM